MALIDFILNLAALLFWLSWLGAHSDPLSWTSTSSLVGTLRRADPAGSKRWKSLAGLLILLVARAVVYWQISSQVRWTPGLDLGIIDLFFHLDPALRLDFLARAFLFSFLSFALTLLTFYLWLLFLSLVNSSVPDSDQFQRLVRLHFRRLERWPAVIKLLAPFLAGALLWLALHPVLTGLAVLPANRADGQLFKQAAILGASTYLLWKYLIVGVLLLHLVNSYVYLGNQAFWKFINATAQNILFPLRWIPLRAGRMDFLPLVAMALVFFAGELVTNPPPWPSWLRPWYYQALPF